MQSFLIVYQSNLDIVSKMADLIKMDTLKIVNIFTIRRKFFLININLSQDR